MGWITSTGNNTFTISGFTTTTVSTASTFTISFGTPVPEKKPKPKKKKTFDQLVAGMVFSQPEVLPMRVYGSCMRCSVSVDMSAFQGRCSACGGPLVHR